MAAATAAGVGTAANAMLVGTVMDVILSLVQPPHALWARVSLLVGGVVGNGIATGLYVGAGLGPGPRDGLSIGVAARGILLGGTAGIGTVLYALGIGPITHVTIPALAVGWRGGDAALRPGGASWDINWSVI